MGADPRPGVLILHQRVSEDSLASDVGVLDEVRALGAALDQLGRSHRVAPVGSIEEVARAVAGGRERVVFNLVEGFEQRAATMVSVPAVCEALGRECTGGDSPCLSLTLDKALTHAALEMAGVPTPAGVCIEPGGVVSPDRLPPPPWIVKPVYADASEGIWAGTSVVREHGRAFTDAVVDIHRRFRQPALVEQLVGTRELNVSVIEEDGQPVVLPIAEIDFSAFDDTRPRIVDYAAKWETDSFEYKNTPRIIPADLPPDVARQVRELAVLAWRATRCRDYARVDFRLEENGGLFVLEVNANPDVSPDAGLAAALEASGRPYVSFVELVVGNAQRRIEERTIAAAELALPALPPQSSRVRPTQASDRDALMEIVRNTANFRPDEIIIAEEVLDDSIRRPQETGYVSLTALDGARPIGWVCYGPTPCTLGTFDIYWIVVDARARRGGWGTELMRAAETGIQDAGGRLVVLDTSGNDAYIPTRGFYSRLGYREAARLADFYAPGDDKVVFAKNLR